jgi:LPPG:FO 2-phospho-L-lactate transferase
VIGGQAVKGPVAKMYRELDIEPCAASVARHYASFLSGFIVDRVDEKEVEAIRMMGIEVLLANTLMKDRSDRLRLAAEVIQFAQETILRWPRNNTGVESV